MTPPVMLGIKDQVEKSRRYHASASTCKKLHETRSTFDELGIPGSYIHGPFLTTHQTKTAPDLRGPLDRGEEG